VSSVGGFLQGRIGIILRAAGDQGRENPKGEKIFGSNDHATETSAFWNST
jgi:hypothetical protein